MRRHEEKDAELDRRIVALRKKNQALLRRYQVSELREPRCLATFKRLFPQRVLSEGSRPCPQALTQSLSLSQRHGQSLGHW